MIWVSRETEAPLGKAVHDAVVGGSDALVFTMAQALQR